MPEWFIEEMDNYIKVALLTPQHLSDLYFDVGYQEDCGDEYLEELGHTFSILEKTYPGICRE